MKNFSSSQFYLPQGPIDLSALMSRFSSGQFYHSRINYNNLKEGRYLL